jgi:uncharacterized protein with PQ loop repeat
MAALRLHALNILIVVALGTDSGKASPSQLFHAWSMDAPGVWMAESLVVISGPVRFGMPALCSMLMIAASLSEVLPRLSQEQTTRRSALLPFSSMFMACAVWTAYGAVVNNLNIVFAHAIGAILSLWYCYAFLRFCPADANWLPYTRGVHAFAMTFTVKFCVFAVMFLANPKARACLGIAANVLWGLTLCGTLKNALQSQRTVSLRVSLLMVVSGAVWTSYAYLMRYDAMILTSSITTLTLGLGQLSLAAFGYTHDEGDVDEKIKFADACSNVASAL